MGVDVGESRRSRSRSVDMREGEDTPMRERWSGEHDDVEENGSDDAGKYRSKDKSRGGSGREDKDRRRDREKSKEREKESKDSGKDRLSSRDRRKDERDEKERERGRDKVREKDADRERHREKDRDKERKDRVKEQDLEKHGDRVRDKERGKEKSRDKGKDREKERDGSKDKEREKHRDRESHRDREDGRDRGKDAVEREKGKERYREKEKQVDYEKERSREKDRSDRKHKDETHDRVKDKEKDDYSRTENAPAHEDQSKKEVMDNSDKEDDSKHFKDQLDAEALVAGSNQSASRLEERISKMREERLKKSSEGDNEVLSWVNRSRKLEEKRNSEKEKALQLSRVFEEQDNMNGGESDDEESVKHATEDLSGVKILHGLDKVLEGGAVVLTLKDQSILADGDINQEVDMLENVEIGEQKKRDEAYKAAKKKTGVYADKFNDEPGVEKKMLPQYDDPVADEGVTLDSTGHFSGEAERKLEELRKRIQGVSAGSRGEDLNSTGKISTDYLTEEEMLKFKKPKKKKSLRKKDKLDIEALEREAVSAGLGAGDLGSRKEGRNQNIREEQDRVDAERRSNAYQSAYTRADEASKALQREQSHSTQTEEDDTLVFGDDDDELRKSLERARKIALKKQEDEGKSGPQAITLLATSTAADSTVDNSNYESGEQQDNNKVIFTEMEEFVWGLQHDEETQKPDSEDVFMEEDVAPVPADEEMKDEDGGWTEVKETMTDETLTKEAEEEVVPDETIHESAVGKGLAATLRLLKDRGALKETIEWGGRNMDKKKSKLVGIVDNDGAKEIRIERTDEYGRILTPKEAFRLLSHKFHGKGPGKMKQEKRMRQYQEELKVKQMKNADTPSQSVERMREAQAKLQTPYLVLSGNIKPGQSSDPRSGFATVEKDLVGGLTPMLGDKKVEHFLNIKRKAEPTDGTPEKKPKT